MTRPTSSSFLCKKNGFQVIKITEVCAYNYIIAHNGSNLKSVGVAVTSARKEYLHVCKRDNRDRGREIYIIERERANGFDDKEKRSKTVSSVRDEGCGCGRKSNVVVFCFLFVCFRNSFGYINRSR